MHPALLGDVLRGLRPSLDLDRGEDDLPLRDRASSLDERGAADLLEDVSGCTGGDCRGQRLVVGERGEHEASELRIVRAKLPAHLDPVAVREPHVEDRDVDGEQRHAHEGLGRGLGLADDLHVGLGVDEPEQALTDDLVVVEHEDLDHLCLLHLSSAAVAARPKQGRKTRDGVPRPCPSWTCSLVPTSRSWR